MTFYFDEGNITVIKGKGAEKNELPVPFSIFRDKDPVIAINSIYKHVLVEFSGSGGRYCTGSSKR